MDKKKGAANAVKRNPAATTSLSLGVIVVALINLLQVELTQEQMNAIVVLMGVVPVLVNWLRSKWSWLDKLVATGYESGDDSVGANPT